MCDNFRKTHKFVMIFIRIVINLLQFSTNLSQICDNPRYQDCHKFVEWDKFVGKKLWQFWVNCDNFGNPYNSLTMYFGNCDNFSKTVTIVLENCYSLSKIVTIYFTEIVTIHLKTVTIVPEIVTIY